MRFPKTPKLLIFAHWTAYYRVVLYTQDLDRHGLKQQKSIEAKIQCRPLNRHGSERPIIEVVMHQIGSGGEAA